MTSLAKRREAQAQHREELRRASVAIERPIMFTDSMVAAIIDGRKTQTRRILKPQPVRGSSPTGPMWGHRDLPGEFAESIFSTCATGMLTCPYGKSRDQLWVRETFSDDWCDKGYPVQYRADGDLDADMYDAGVKWRPSIFMPRRASRITLEITSVRVERLQEISEEDAKAEGVTDSYPEQECNSDRPFAEGFGYLWDSINAAKAPWASSPWVWVVGFVRL